MLSILSEPEFAAVALPAIPRLLVAFAEWAAIACAPLVSKPRLSKPLTVAVLAAALVVQVLLRCIPGDYTVRLFFFGLMAINLAAMLVWLAVLVDEELPNLVFLWLLCFLLAEFEASLSWQLCGVLLHSDRLVDPACLLLCAAMLGLSGALFVVITRAAGGRVDDLGRSYAAIAAGVTLLVFLASNANVFREGLWRESGQSDIGEMIGWIRTVSDLCGLALLWMLLRIAGSNRLRQEVELVNRLMDSQYQQYEAFRESNDFVRRQCHDLKHQITALREAGGADEEWLAEMEREVQRYNAQHDTGNPVLDTILTQKQLVCDGAGIALSCQMDAGMLGSMDARDICVLFGNMLDNAIEAVSNLPAEQRAISVSAGARGSMLAVIAENPCAHEVAFRDGIPLTSKPDSKVHGIGARSIRAVAEKYGGTASFSLDDGWFVCTVLLPLGE